MHWRSHQIFGFEVFLPTMADRSNCNGKHMDSSSKSLAPPNLMKESEHNERSSPAGGSGEDDRQSPPGSDDDESDDEEVETVGDGGTADASGTTSSKKRKAASKPFWETNSNNGGVISRRRSLGVYSGTETYFRRVAKKPVLKDLLLDVIATLRKNGKKIPRRIKRDRRVFGYKTGNTTWSYDTFERHVIARCAVVFAYGVEWEPVNKKEAVLTWIKKNEDDMWRACLYFLTQVPQLDCHNYDQTNDKTTKSTKFNKFNRIMTCNTHTWKRDSIVTEQFMLKGVYSENYEGTLTSEDIKGAVYYHHFKAVDSLWNLSDKYDSAVDHEMDLWHISTEEKQTLLEGMDKIWKLTEKKVGSVPGDVKKPAHLASLNDLD